jgi:hypothetical protein
VTTSPPARSSTRRTALGALTAVVTVVPLLALPGTAHAVPGRPSSKRQASSEERAPLLHSVPGALDSDDESPPDQPRPGGQRRTGTAPGRYNPLLAYLAGRARVRLQHGSHGQAFDLAGRGVEGHQVMLVSQEPGDRRFLFFRKVGTKVAVTELTGEQSQPLGSDAWKTHRKQLNLLPMGRREYTTNRDRMFDTFAGGFFPARVNGVRELLRNAPGRYVVLGTGTRSDDPNYFVLYKRQAGKIAVLAPDGDSREFADTDADWSRATEHYQELKGPLQMTTGLLGVKERFEGITGRPVSLDSAIHLAAYTGDERTKFSLDQYGHDAPDLHFWLLRTPEKLVLSRRDSARGSKVLVRTSLHDWADIRRTLKNAGMVKPELTVRSLPRP